MSTTPVFPLLGREERVIAAFGYMIIMCIKELGQNQSYGDAISVHMINKLQKIVDKAQIYVTLDRLSKQKLLSHRVVKNPNKSGHHVKIYAITEKGREECKRAAAFYNHLYVQEGYWT